MSMFPFTKSKSIGNRRVYHWGMGLPVLSSETLLNTPAHRKLLSQVAILTTLNETQFQSVYLSFIQQFAEYVQMLPRLSSRILLSLMNDGLRRGLYGLTQYTEATPLEKYALFTAAVLLDIQEVFINQNVYITDKGGQFLKEWNPFLGNLREAGANYYRLMLSDSYPLLRLSISTVAEALLPKEGYAWITSDKAIFSDWLAALYGMEGETSSRLLLIVQLLKREIPLGFGYELPFLPEIEEKLIEAYVDTQDIDQFLAWLQGEIENQSIRLNEDIFLFPDKQIFIPQEIIDRFITQHRGLKGSTWKIIRQQFGNLFGLVKLSGSDHVISQLFSEDPRRMPSSQPGLAVSASLIIDEAKLLNVSLSKAVTPHLFSRDGK
jgi:hypothetical protein